MGLLFVAWVINTQDLHLASLATGLVPTSALPDWIVGVAALFLARPIYRRFPLLVSMDRHWIYGKLNRQLLYLLLLFCFTLAWLQWARVFEEIP